MRWIPFLLPLLLAAAFVIGWTAPGASSDPLGVTRGGGGGSLGPILRPGDSTNAAVDFLKTLASDPVPPPPPPVPVPPPPPPPPPPPDVAITFKAALRAISRDEAGDGYQAIVRDIAQPGPQTIAMSVGDVFDGWRIGAISADTVTLQRGRETRVVRLFG